MAAKKTTIKDETKETATEAPEEIKAEPAAEPEAAQETQQEEPTTDPNTENKEESDGESTSAEESEEDQADNAKKPKFTIERKLQFGAEGKDVKSLQRALIEKGFKCLENGIYDHRTAQAVRQFQHKNGFPVNGVAGENTIPKLGGKWSPKK